MARPYTLLALCACVAFTRSGECQASRTDRGSPADYAAIAAADYRTMPSRVGRLLQQSEVEVITACADLAPRCRRLRSSVTERNYDARLLDSATYVALLPNEVAVRGVPYYTWLPASALKNGGAVLDRWRTLAGQRFPLGCREGECGFLVFQEPNDRHSSATISACYAEQVTDPPARCEALAILTRERGWLRAVIGWGDSTVAASLQPSPIVEDFEAERRLSILQLAKERRGAIVQAINAALIDKPLKLTTELRPAVNPSAVKGRRATEVSDVVAPFREWASVRADLEPPVASAGDTTVSAIELTTTLWLSRTASSQPTRPASAAETGRYVGELLKNITREIARVCGASFVGDRIVCR